MKISNDEVLLLQDVTGNSSLALKHIHSQIRETIDERLLLEISRLGHSLTSIAESVLKTHKPFSYKKKE